VDHPDPRRRRAAGGNSLIFIAPSLDDKSGYAHQMGNVRDVGAFAGLLMMQAGSELQGGIKSPSQEGRVWFHVLIVRVN